MMFLKSLLLPSYLNITNKRFVEKEWGVIESQKKSPICVEKRYQSTRIIYSIHSFANCSKKKRYF